MNKRILACAIPALLIVACSKEVPPPAPPRPVAALVVGSSEASREQSFSGEVRARHETPLGFRIGGKITARLVDAGAVVKMGQPLARLDPADVALQASQAAAQLAQVDADTKRFRELRAKNFISQSALDAHETALTAARSQAGLARNQADYATLHADANGIVSAVLAEAGQVVAAGTPVFMLAQQGEREVLISIPESRIGRYKVGDVAAVSLWADEAKTYHGRIREITPAADPATRTYPARIALTDADTAVALGMTAKVVFTAKDTGGMLVPASAIYQQGEQPAVWVIDDKGITSVRPVRVSAWQDGGAVITEGLKPGERIVASGVHKVHAGEKVVFGAEKNAGSR